MLPGNMLQTLRNTRRQGNRPDRRTKVRRGAVDAVSKNAFAQPFFTAVRNSFTYPILILCQMTYLHFCGAWVYQQSDPLWNATGGHSLYIAYHTISEHILLLYSTGSSIGIPSTRSA